MSAHVEDQLPENWLGTKGHGARRERKRVRERAGPERGREARKGQRKGKRKGEWRNPRHQHPDPP